MSELPLLIVMPAYNEEAAVGDVLDELHRELADVHVLVVDDGSDDHTAALARSHGAIVAPMPFNSGIGGALRCGFRFARRHGYPRVVQFDADGQHDPAEIKAIVDPIDAGADMTVGSRFAGRGAYDAGRVRGAAMGMLRWGVRLATGRRFTDTSSGFRAFGPAALDLFADHYPYEYMESVEALVMACSNGLDVVEVPVRMRARADGVPSTGRFRLVYHFVRVAMVMVSLTLFRRRYRVQEDPS